MVAAASGTGEDEKGGPRWFWNSSAVNPESCALGEEPVYDDRGEALWYCDIVRRRHSSHHALRRRRAQWASPTEVGSFGLTGRAAWWWRFATRSASSIPRAVASAASPRSSQAGQGDPANDGKVGPDGAFWVGTMDDRDLPSERRWARSTGSMAGRLERKIEDLRVSNGLAFSPDGKTMFHSDFKRQVDRPLVVRCQDRRDHQPHPHRRA